MAAMSWGDLVLGGAFGGAAQDKAVGALAVHGVLGEGDKAGALLIVADLARDVEAGRAGRDDGIAGLEEEAVGHGTALAPSALPVTWTSMGSPVRNPLAPRSQAVAPLGRRRNHAPLPLQAPVGEGAEDGARTGGGVVVDQEVVELAVDEQGRGLASVEAARTMVRPFMASPQPGGRRPSVSAGAGPRRR
jgi:hypothetical protein